MSCFNPACEHTLHVQAHASAPLIQGSCAGRVPLPLHTHIRPPHSSHFHSLLLQSPLPHAQAR